MTQIKHSLELVDEDKDIWECTVCKVRGKLFELVNGGCEEKKEEPKPSGTSSMFRDFLTDLPPDKL